MRALIPIFVLCLIAPCALAQELQYARLGDFKLENGQVIRECHIGFRTIGKLDAEHSNAVLFTTYFGGTTQQIAQFIDWLGLNDYYVIAVDALGDGVSSSPSNSPLQPRMRFPQFTLRDMVETQHELLVDHLGIRHLKAVMGVSMGGMQTFQWMVAYPGFMDAAIPMLGAPRLAPYSLLHLKLGMDLITSDPAWRRGNYHAPPSALATAELADLIMSTPERFNMQMDRDSLFHQVARSASRTVGHDANDKIRQTQAMLKFDISSAFAGSMAAAASAVRAHTLIIVSKSDHVVTPGPALEFAKLLNARALVLDDDCGHAALHCEHEKVAAAIHELLDADDRGTR